MKKQPPMTIVRRSALVAAVLALVAVPSFAVDLVAVATEWEPPGGGTPIPMWAFQLGTECPATPPAWDVGPAIRATAGDTISISLRNCLAEPISLIVPGLQPTLPPDPVWVNAAGTVVATGARPIGDTTSRVRSFTNEVAPASSVTYEWTARAGSFIYQSGTMVSKQVPMGLYGPVIVEAATGEAYTGITYGNEAILFYSEIDPAVNTAGVPASADYRPQYFLVNGASFPAAAPMYAAPPTAGEALLVRFFNAGLETAMPMLDGVLAQVVAEDGNVTPGGSVYPATPAAYSLLLAAGKTLDAMIAAVPAGKHAVIDRTLRLDNGPAVDGNGGQLVFLDYTPGP
jgi:hypothetical protein